MRHPLLLLTIVPCLALFACSAETATDEGSVDVSEGELGTNPSIPQLPAPGGTGVLAPWGGSDPANWRPEAIVANAASLATNEAWSRADVKDVVVAIPMRLWSSGFFEFGDGQANARPELEFWKEKRPPVVGSVIKFKNGPTKLRVRFDRALPYAGTSFELRYDTTLLALTAVRDAQGDAVVEIDLPQGLSFDNLLSEQSALIHPMGWVDWFPLHFRMPVKKISDLRASQMKFSDGKSVIDREKVTSIGATDGKSTRERLSAHSFSAGYNGAWGSNVQPFIPQSIHATYPFFGRTFVTGVGKGWTWVADERPQGFKVMYTCFERRRQDLEASAPNGGVASGGGWHQINDAAETILNDLETEPLMVASGKNEVWATRDLPSGRWAYGLQDVATFRWLRPGEAFITVKGPSSNPNYHWYFFHGAKDVCTEELINPQGQVPQNFDL